jgi:hypothetical protein
MAHVLSKEVLAIAVYISAIPMGFSSSIDVVEELQPFFVWPRLSIKGRQSHAAIAQGRDLGSILAQLAGRYFSRSHFAN